MSALSFLTAEAHAWFVATGAGVCATAWTAVPALQAWDRRRMAREEEARRLLLRPTTRPGAIRVDAHRADRPVTSITPPTDDTERGAA